MPTLRRWIGLLRTLYSRTLYSYWHMRLRSSVCTVLSLLSWTQSRLDPFAPTFSPSLPLTW